MKEHIITPIDDKEAVHPNMLKCINCGEPAAFYVNGRRVCFDKVCFNKFTGAFNELSLHKEIDDAHVCIQKLLYVEKEIDNREKKLEIAKKRLNELLEERTKRYREYLGEE